MPEKKYTDYSYNGLATFLKKKNNPVLSIDIETYKEDGTSFKKGDGVDYFSTLIRTIQISNGVNTILIDVDHELRNPDDFADIASLLSSYTGIWVGHNIKYDCAVILKEFGIRLYEKATLFDTMIASQMLSNGKDNLKHDLYSVIHRYLGIRVDSPQLDLFVPHVDKKIRTTYNEGPLNALQAIYAVKDAEYTFRLYKALKTKIREENLDSGLTHENKFVGVVVEMEFNGMPFNEEAWMKLYERSNKLAIGKLDALTDYADINWNSQKQVLPVFKHFGIPTEFLDKDSGEYKDTIAKSKVSKFRNDFDVLDTYLDYKQFVKLSGTYGKNYIDKYLNKKTGRIHPSVIQFMHTSRTSCSKPNLQNQPSSEDFRHCYESDTQLFMSDYSSQEMAVLANNAKETTMAEAIISGRDLHSWTASQVWKVPVSSTQNAHLRKMAKGVNFG